MKEICKNCALARPTYKGCYCDQQKKKVKTGDTCDQFTEKEKSR